MDYTRSVYFLYPIFMATFILAAIYSIPCAHRYQIGSGALVPPPLKKKSPILHNYIPDVAGNCSPNAHKQEVSSVTETVMHAESSVVPVSDLIGDTVLLPESDATLNYNIGNAQPRPSSEGNATDTVGESAASLRSTMPKILERILFESPWYHRSDFNGTRAITKRLSSSQTEEYFERQLSLFFGRIFSNAEFALPVTKKMQKTKLSILPLEH